MRTCQKTNARTRKVQSMPMAKKLKRTSAQDAAPHAMEPSCLKCPITKKMYRDPVCVFPSGQTYDRDAIWAWKGGMKDPLTGENITCTSTNWALRKCVQEWLDTTGGTPEGWETPEMAAPRFTILNDIHEAARQGNLTAVKRILDNADDDDLVNRGDQEGRTPLHYAAMHGYLEIVVLLVETYNATVDKKDAAGKTALKLGLESELIDKETASDLHELFAERFGMGYQTANMCKKFVAWNIVNIMLDEKLDEVNTKYLADEMEISLEQCREGALELLSADKAMIKGLGLDCTIKLLEPACTIYRSNMFRSEEYQDEREARRDRRSR